MGIRDYPATPRVYLDMDGVLADFELGCKAFDCLPAAGKLLPNIYRNLPVIPGAKRAVHALERHGFLLFVLTKIPRKNPLAATEKLRWLAEHFQSIDDRVIITPDKGAVGKPCDFLIDDHPEWANANAFPGTVVKFDGDWEATLAILLSFDNR